jgi:hypothetical protein
MLKIQTSPVIIWPVIGIFLFTSPRLGANNQKDVLNLKKAAHEELFADPSKPSTKATIPRNSHPVELQDDAQGILKLSNPYEIKQTRSYKINMALLGQKYQAGGTFKQDVGPDIRLNEYPEIILPSLEFSTDKNFEALPNLSWGGHIKASFMTQNQRFTLGTSKTKTEDAQLNTFIAQIGPNIKYRLWERIKMSGQVSAGVFQQTQTSSSSFLRNSDTKSIWSVSTGPEISLSKDTQLIFRYEHRALVANAETVAIQNGNTQIGLGFIW